MHLSDLQCGHYAQVIGFAKGERFYRQKLLAMGLTPGTPFRLTRVAPLGDPVEIRVRGYSLSLRKAEANILNIRRMESICSGD
jgi:ferrous iron transport protein A